MATPRAEYWKLADQPREWGLGPQAGPWRKAATDPPPAPPTEVFWLERRSGEPDFLYMSRVANGAEPSFRAAQLP
jgi:hypothetical protein